MKESLLIPIKYLLTFCGTLLILTVFNYIYRWESSLALNAENWWHINALLTSGHAALLPASLVAFVVLILLIQHRPGKALLSFIAVWISFGGVHLLLSPQLAPYAGIMQAPEAPVTLDQRIHNYRNGALYLESGGEGAAGILLVPEESPRMQAGPIQSDGAARITIGSSRLEQRPSNPFFDDVLQPSWVLAPVFKDFQRIESTFALIRDASPRGYLLLIASFSLLITSLWIFGRFTEWPLLNTVFLLFAVRIVVLLLSLLLSPGAQELSDSFLPGTRIIDQLPLIMLGGAALLMLWDLLFVPYRRGKARQI